MQYYRAYQLINKTYEFASAVCFTSGIAIKNRIKYSRKDQSTDSLDQVRRNACECTGSVDKVLAQAVTAGNENDISNTAEDDCCVTAFGILTYFTVKKGGAKGYQSFDHECDRNIDKNILRAGLP